MHGFDELKCIWTWIDTDETAEIYDNILWIGSSKHKQKIDGLTVMQWNLGNWPQHYKQEQTNR